MRIAFALAALLAATPALAQNQDKAAEVDHGGGAAGYRSIAGRFSRPLGLEFTPVDPDTFLFGNFTLRFVRDTARNVVALDLTSPVFRHVRFTRR